MAFEALRVGFYSAPRVSAHAPPSAAASVRGGSVRAAGGALSVVSEQLLLGGGAGEDLREDEQLRRINGLFLGEWTRFVDHERRQRQRIEREVQVLMDTMAELKVGTISQVERCSAHLSA